MYAHIGHSTHCSSPHPRFLPQVTLDDGCRVEEPNGYIVPYPFPYILCRALKATVQCRKKCTVVDTFPLEVR